MSPTVTAQTLRERIARNIRARRSAQGLTQEALAHRAGLATRHLQKIEAAQVNLTLDTICKLASAVGVDPVELLSEPGTVKA